MNNNEIKKILEQSAFDIFEDRKKLLQLFSFLVTNPHLSLYQSVQILSVEPTAKICHTFTDWNNFDRRIQRGSKGIPVLDESFPYTRRYVFDISQTYGKSLEESTQILDNDLERTVRSLSAFHTQATGSYQKRLFFATDDFCKDYYFEEETNGDQLNLALAAGVFSCVVKKYNKPDELILLGDFAKLNISDTIKVVARVVEVSKILFENIDSKRRENYGEHNEKRVNRSIQGINAKHRTITGAQRSIFDDEYQQVWGIGQELSAGGVPRNIPETADERRVDGIDAESSKGSRGIDGNIDDTASQEESIAEGRIIHREVAIRDGNTTSGGGDSSKSSNIHTSVNYKLTDEDFLSRGGQKQRFRSNLEAIKLVQELEAEQRTATSAEQKILSKYVGWGGLPQAFDELNKDWQREYQELRNTLQNEDYRLAKASVLTAHYTSKTVIDGIYGALNRLGFKNGSILEPACGTGNFLGLMPEDFSNNIHAVEIDNITGKIAKYLYPQANIKVCGFEETDYPNNYFDSVITNVPFGAYKVFDKEYNKHNLFIHDYFILKSLDKLRPGGVAAFITTKGTLDKLNFWSRRLFSEKANLVGAIRLPNNAFKETAGTDVTADILFFKKHSESTKDVNPSWLHLDQNADGIYINQYFIEHPDMLLGKMVQEKSMYGGDDETACIPDGRDLSQALIDAVQQLPQNIYQERKVAVAESKGQGNSSLPADLNVKNFCYAVIDEKIYQRVDEEMLPQEFSVANTARMKALIGLRSQARHVLEIQTENCSDEELAKQQHHLNSLYDSFIKQYGLLNSRANTTLFRDDADYALLITLENYDEVTNTAQKTDIFSKRTIRQYVRPTSASSALEALYISKNETGKVNLQIIEDLTGKSFDEIVKELKGNIYRNPYDIIENDKYSGWETAAEYLSGNVLEKLRFVETYGKTHPEFAENIVALREVQPAPLSADEISVRIGATWISTDIYKQFMAETLNLTQYSEVQSFSVNYNSFDGTWKVDAPFWLRNRFESINVYGTERTDAFRLYEQALNLQMPSVYDTVVVDGKDTRVLNKAETISAREKLKKIQTEFKDWIFDNVTRRNYLVSVYNQKFNNTRLTNYDGSYLTFPEMNPQISLKQHQKDAVERIIAGGNTLLHHVVGAGKTFEIAAAAMKLRQMKIAQKPMIIVPNHLVMQWANEFRTLYPNANLLIASKKDFEKQNRLKFVSRIAMGDWDAVVIAMSSFEKIPLSKERQRRKIESEIDNIRDAINDARYDSNSRITIKILEKTLKSKETALKLLLETKKDDLIKFEDLGVDYIFVDEAHKYKNKFIFTKMNNVAGISQAASKRASDLDMKIEYINEVNGGQKGVVFATGTPISNSMVEMYTIQSYLQRDTLTAAGLNYFDAWAATFGETQTALELAPSGQGYRSRTRFAKFTNLPELLTMYRSFADVKTADMLNLPVPIVNKQLYTLKPSEEVLRLNDIISKRAEQISSGNIDPHVDNMLKITSDGKKLALDPRCFDSSAKDSSENKVNVCIENIYEIWKDTMQHQSTQVVFCDLSVPKKPFIDYDPEKDFDVYNHIKYKLVAMGIPQEEVAFVHDAETDLQKQLLFENVRNGSIRILIGSTEKCGAGTNIQTKLIALHHLDTPYRPSDLEQREGRIVRQGNSNPEVKIFTYVTERTFDSYSYQILENKQRFIAQINKGELTVREAADIDEATLTYAEIKAITAANPLIKRKNEVENELGQLRVLEGQFKKNKYSLQDEITIYLPKTISDTREKLKCFESDIALRNVNSGEKFEIIVADQRFTERKDAGELLQAHINSNKYVDKKIASFCGFDIYAERQTRLDEKTVILKGAGSYRVTVSDSAVGTITRLENYVKALDENSAKAMNKLDIAQKELEVAKRELNKPFEYQEKIESLVLELAKIDAELDLSKEETSQVVDDEEFQNERRTVDDDEDDAKDSLTEKQKALAAKYGFDEKVVETVLRTQKEKELTRFKEKDDSLTKENGNGK